MGQGCPPWRGDASPVTRAVPVSDLGSALHPNAAVLTRQAPPPQLTEVVGPAEGQCWGPEDTWSSGNRAGCVRRRPPRSEPEPGCLCVTDLMATVSHCVMFIIGNIRFIQSCANEIMAIKSLFTYHVKCSCRRLLSLILQDEAAYYQELF